MKTNVFKSVLFLTSTAILLPLALAGCSKEPDYSLKLKEQAIDYDSPMKEIGLSHNLGLDFVLEELKAMPATRAAAERAKFQWKFNRHKQ